MTAPAPVDVFADLRKLYDSIIAKASNTSVNSLSHKGRSVGYGDTPLRDMIKAYRLLWTKESGLPEIPLDLDASSASRGCFQVRLS